MIRSNGIAAAMAAALVSVPALVTPGQTAAQTGAIVQPLPPPEAEDLNIALRRLAEDPRDLEALLDAGEAAIALDDIDAAIGFFGRAEEISPDNSRILLGKASAFLRSRRPIEALRLFAAAERAGVTNERMAAERGLAYDLVGDAASAQQLYRLALSGGADPEITRRLALSQAIAGDKAGFEATLLPLLQEGDLAAFRTRAFGLAILGQTAEAIGIVEDVMPAQLAARFTPYLRYMPQLTPAQQASAVNLGVFPRAADIGTDNQRIAGYTAEAPASSRRSGATLEPAGAPLGASAASSPAPQPAPSEAIRTVSGAVVQPLPAAATAPAVVPVREPAQPPAADPPVTVARMAPPPASPAPEPEPSLSVADAFSGFDLAPADSVSAGAGAVDITAIEIPREVAEPEPPAHPARHWVQIATGKDRAALKWDWRRIAREADGKLDGLGPFVTPWVEANRLLAGPYPSAEAAREVVNELNALGIDSFPFSSVEGEVIEELR